jgi:hypothetical protein
VPIRIALTGSRSKQTRGAVQHHGVRRPRGAGAFQKFDRTFIVRNHWGRPTRYRNLPLLHEAMADVMYRKSRKDVADQFPRINTAVIPFYLSDVEATMYERVRDYVLNLLLEATSQFGAGFNLAAHYGADHDPASEQMKGDIMAAVMILRQISDDANLVLESAANYDAGKGLSGADWWMRVVRQRPCRLVEVIAMFKGSSGDGRGRESKVVEFSVQGMRDRSPATRRRCQECVVDRRHERRTDSRSRSSRPTGPLGCSCRAMLVGTASTANANTSCRSTCRGRPAAEHAGPHHPHQPSSSRCSSPCWRRTIDMRMQGG